MSGCDIDEAIICEKVSKEFYILDDKLSWRIIFRDIKEPLDSFNALTNVDLFVPKGKFVGILGRNGAGKSTLLRLLGGVYPPTTGIVKTYGAVSGLFEMGGMGSRRLTGQAYAARYFDMFGISRQKRRELIDNIREFSELGSYFKKPLYTYSAGMLARLYFSTATELQQEIYLVDELLSVGDEHFQSKCWKRLRERFTNGASGVLVTHDWSAILKLCEFSYILDKGVIQTSGCSELMVQRYLRLPKPSKEYAEFLINPEGYLSKSGKNSEFVFNLLVKKEVNLALSYSVELFRSGFGWDIILLNEDYVPLACTLGNNTVKITIPRLPLVSGEYYLNIFLKSLDEHVDSHQLDSRSWTYGNGIKLKVQGLNSLATTLLPWSIEFKEVSHVFA